MDVEKTEEGIINVLRPLEAPDVVQEAARLHFCDLQRDVFGKLHIDWRDSGACHSRAIAELAWTAASGFEGQRSVCFGLIYGLLAYDVGRSTAAYWDYLALLRSLDGHDVAMRSLLAFVRRCHDLQPAALSRLVALLRDMANAQWPLVQKVVSALQRELLPGDPRIRSLDFVSDVVDLSSSCAADADAAQLTFLWLARWASALREPVASLCPTEAHEALRTSCVELAVSICQCRRRSRTLMLAGPVLWWVLLPCRKEPSLAAMWQSLLAQENDVLSTVAPQHCLDHLLSYGQQEQLLFLSKDNVACREGMQVGWFLRRHFPGTCLGGAQAAGTSYGDCILWALAAVEASGAPRPSLWQKFWSHAGHEGQLAFAFAAACERGARGSSGYACAALRSLVAPSAALALLKGHLPGLAADQLAEALAAEARESIGDVAKK